jgi:hypothetical protein
MIIVQKVTHKSILARAGVFEKVKKTDFYRCRISGVAVQLEMETIPEERVV